MKSISILVVTAVMSCALGLYIGTSMQRSTGTDVDQVIASWLAEDGFPVSTLDLTNVDELFPLQMRDEALRVQREFGVPAPVTLAQYALESRFGRSAWAKATNNYFGHKFPVTSRYGTPPPLSSIAYTKEFTGGEWTRVPQKFARYKSIEECFTTHGRFMQTVFGKGTDAQRYARHVAKRYATDPDYATKLIVIMKRYNLIG